MEAPDEGYSSNAATAAIGHDGAIWLATGEGVLFSSDNGQTWASYHGGNGLVSDIVSALYSNGSRLWVGTSHSEVIDGRKYSMSDGVSYTDNNGDTWNQVDFSSSGQNISSVYGGYRTIYDITGHEDWVFFAAFAGGFLASNDGGLNWRRLFPSREDSIQFNAADVPSEGNRYFSCAADSSHGDSLFVWTGTAGGVFQYVFAPEREKLSSRHVSSIAFCADCIDSAYVFFGGENGVTRGVGVGAPYLSRSDGDGLTGASTTALFHWRSRLFAASEDELDGQATGLAFSDDNGESYEPVTGLDVDFDGSGDNHITELTAVGERLYLAATEAGMFVSRDTGLTWDRILIDSTSPPSNWNVVNAVTSYYDTLLVGTDTGMATLYLAMDGMIDSTRFYPFAEYDSSSTRVIGIRVQEFLDDAATAVDSVAVWTVNRPLTSVGRPIVARRKAGATDWQLLQVGVRTHDIAFWGDTAFAVGEAGIRFTTIGANTSNIYRVVDIRSGVRVDSLNFDVIYEMEVNGDTVVIGSSNGFAMSTDRGATYRITRPNLDPLAPDVVIHHNSLNALHRLIGDFVPAIAVQYDDSDSSRVWVSNRSVPYWPDTNAISVGKVVAIDENGDEIESGSGATIAGYKHLWNAVYRGGFAWNFAFNGDSVFAATDAGLLYYSDDPEPVWDTIPLQSETGSPLVLEGSAVYGVAVHDGYLWVATSDRTVQIDLGDFDDQQAHFVIDSASPPDEVYAFPVPFSHANDDHVDFHFAVEQEGEVTLEIYDFAMNLVYRVIDGQRFPKGIYPTVGAQRPVWDGRNGKGDEVAVGVYYFKVEVSGGDPRWGKLAVIP